MAEKCKVCGKLVELPFACCSEKCNRKLREKPKRVYDSINVSYEAYCDMFDFFNMEMGGTTKPFTRKKFDDLKKETQLSYTQAFSGN